MDIEDIKMEDVQMCSKLTEEPKEEFLNLIIAHVKAFTKRHILGKIDGFEANIDTGNNQLPNPAAQRPVG
jgi:hypothetical protein